MDQPRIQEQAANAVEDMGLFWEEAISTTLPQTSHGPFIHIDEWPCETPDLEAWVLEDGTFDGDKWIVEGKTFWSGPDDSYYSLTCRACKYRETWGFEHTSPYFFIDTFGVFICEPCRKRSTRARVDYPAYLRSPEWQVRRALALRSAGHKCQLCSSRQKLQVHHNTYDRLGDEDPRDLVVLCSVCHEAFHSVLKVGR